MRSCWAPRWLRRCLPGADEARRRPARHIPAAARHRKAVGERAARMSNARATIQAPRQQAGNAAPGAGAASQYGQRRGRHNARRRTAARVRQRQHRSSTATARKWRQCATRSTSHPGKRHAHRLTLNPLRRVPAALARFVARHTVRVETAGSTPRRCAPRALSRHSCAQFHTQGAQHTPLDSAALGIIRVRADRAPRGVRDRPPAP